jgi:hypothetical protein
VSASAAGRQFLLPGKIIMARTLAKLVFLGVVAVTVAYGGEAEKLQKAHRKLFVAGEKGNKRKMISALDKKSGEAMREMLEMCKDMGTEKQYLAALKKDAQDAIDSYSEPRIDGDKATIAVKRKSGRVETIEFAKEDGRWRVSAPRLIRDLPGIRAVHAATMRKRTEGKK